jgi:hypothetical protein
MSVNNVWMEVTDPFESCPDLYKVTQEHLDEAWRKMEYIYDISEMKDVYVGWKNITDVYDKINFIINLEKESGISIQDYVAEWLTNNDFSFFLVHFRDKKINDLL